MKYARLKSEMDKFVERSQKEDIPSLVITNDTGKYKVPLKSIDNAMEASERLPEDQRLVTVKAERVRDMLIITVENNTLPGTRPAEGTTKKDRFVHGFGIPNIKKAVEKYDGQCSFHQGDGTYLLKILIPIP